MAQNFLSALIEAAASDATLAAAGLGTWHFGVDPGPDYPYVVIASIGTKISHRNFGLGQLHEDHYRINVFADDSTEADTLGGAASTFLESLQAAPLEFDGGRQVDFHQTGEDLVPANRRRPGTGATPFVWLRSLTWVLKYSRDRV